VAPVAVMKGHRISPDTIRLDRPLPADIAAVQVVLDETPSSAASEARLSALLKGLPVGARTKTDIDQQIQDERDSWQR
jgi:hypothetical protein